MDKSLLQVKEFSEKFGKLVNETPQIVSNKDFNFIYNFIKEELEEMKEAHADRDIVGVADALGDIKYVLNAGILAYGLQEAFDEVEDEIQASNMSKACVSIEEAEETIKAREKEFGFNIVCHWEKQGDSFIVYRTHDRKVMKSINYFKPDLKKILDKYIK